MSEPRNREQRRAEQFHREHPDHDDARIEQHEQKLITDSAPQDVLSVRAKGSGHGKKTADKWNQ